MSDRNSRGHRDSERLLADEKLRRRADYLRCYRGGRRVSGPLFTLHFVETGHEGPRVGITVSRKVGNAVVRNRVKRLVREAYRRWPGRRDLPALDVVVHARPRAAGASAVEVRDEIVTLLGEVSRPRRAGR